MEDRSQEGKERQQTGGRQEPPHFEQIDPHREDQHRPAGNSPDRVDLNLEGAKRHHDSIPQNPDTADPGLTPQPPNPGVVPAGGYPDEAGEKKRAERPGGRSDK